MDEETLLAFETVADPQGIEIIDRVEQLRYQLYTPAPVSPTPVSPESFVFPVGKGVRVQTEGLSLPSDVGVIVRDGDGEMLTEIEHLDSESFGDGTYVLDLSTQVKSYVRVDGPLDITSSLVETEFAFDSERAVDIGFRSRHNRPAATVTTTTDPVDLMRAVSTFGSALKSTSPERSFPTLRGHPPQVELGSTLDVPDSIDLPETGVEIAVPPACETIYPVAPLSYYLGAEVVPGQHPTLRAETGFEYAFDYPSGFEQDVAETLKQVFLFDCAARTEGFYRVDLHERSALEAYLDLDWAALYDQPLAERLDPYLSVPYSVIADHVPEWRLTTHVDPTADTIEQLPFVVDDLAVVRTVEPTATPSTGPSGRVVDDESATRADGDVLTRSVAEPATRSASETSEETKFVEPEETGSLEQAWIGDHIPIGASKLTSEAFRNRLDREVPAGDITITIVLNDSRMDEERDLVDRAYGDREDLPFDVTVCQDLTVEGLRDRLAEDRSFMHYIGHIDQNGFDCADGTLDAATLDSTGIDAFLLNACCSYQQGLHLIDAGAIGGIVTLTDIISDRAVKIGEMVSRLLNVGFPLRAALTIAREETILGGQYIVVGDGGMTVTQPQSRTPNLLDITPGEEFAVDIRTFATDTAGLGSMYTPYIGDNSEYFLSSGTIGPFHPSRDELDEFLQLEDVPVKFSADGLRWSSSVSLDEL